MRAVFPTAEYFDADGYVWQLDPATLELRPIAPSRMYRAFSSTNCTGPAHYVQNTSAPFIAPRMTFTVQGHPGIRVRNDNAQVIQLGVCSTDSGGVCQLTGPCPWNTGAILETDTMLVATPVVAAMPPIRPVFAQ